MQDSNKGITKRHMRDTRYQNDIILPESMKRVPFYIFPVPEYSSSIITCMYVHHEITYSHPIYILRLNVGLPMPRSSLQVVRPGLAGISFAISELIQIMHVMGSKCRTTTCTNANKLMVKADIDTLLT